MTAAPAFPRPRLVLSRCLELDACRYNAVSIRTPLVRALEPFVELVPVCPEVEIGLGVPRDPIRLVRAAAPRAIDSGPSGETRLVQPSTGRDLTREMRSLSSRFLEGLGPVDGFLLKARSPSCGPEEVKIFDDPEAADPVASGTGMFAAAVRERFPFAPIEHEVRLLDPAVLEPFLARIFCSARLRSAAAGGREGLVAYHAAHRWILAVHDPEAPARLERRLTGAECAPDARVRDEYVTGVAEALARTPTPASHAAVLQRALELLRDRLPEGEMRRWEALLSADPDAHEREPLLALLRSWAGELPVEREAARIYLDPYPPALRETAPGN